MPRCRHRSPRQPTPGADLGVGDASIDDIYAAMDWPASQQDDIETKLAREYRSPQPGRLLEEAVQAGMTARRSRNPTTSAASWATSGLRVGAFRANRTHKARLASGNWSR